MEIIINCELLKKKGEELIEKAAQLESKINLMLSEIEVLASSWNSSTGKTYISMMHEKFINPLKKLKNVLETKGNYMISVAKTYNLFEEYYYNIKIID